MTQACIVLKDLCKNYLIGGKESAILKHLNLTIPQGEFVALMGPSGSGKTTLMNIVGCLDTPSSGDYFLNGTNVAHLTPDEQAALRNQTIGFVFQSFNLLPRANLINNVALPMVYAGVAKKERLERAQLLLERVGLGKRGSAMPNEISGGEQQRVAVARALVNRPKLLLADEPTGNLDTATSDAIMALFTELNREGLTIFLVTHENDIAAYAKRLIKMRDGVIVSD